ncbi:hypothetical protein LJR225_001373 [Phenylobacterium sp. LjRoot225]|uniref:hypothetical protein n=1 Tax=Phenylobacterium sp. LjRoot225 TaxID=3342285 RepID=UPI003ECEA36C
MNTLGRILLLVGGLVLALLVGVLIGRSQRVESIAPGNAQAVQITTAPPPALPAVTPLPATVPPPQPAAVPAPIPIAPDLQVQEDAAAVGMTTRDGDDEASQPKSAAGGADPSGSQPIG